MNYGSLVWQSDCMSTEFYADDNMDEFVVGIYLIAEFPEVVLYINTETGRIIDVELMDLED